MKDNDIGLLLAYADTLGPVLEDGLDLDAAAKGDATGKKESPIAPFDNDAADPSDLYEQRWGLVVPRGPQGKRLRELVAPLVALREEQQGGEALVYEVSPGMSAEETLAWCKDEYTAETNAGKKVTKADWPRYLLLLGGPELISWEFQITVGSSLFVGRLAFPDEAAYEAYVAKVLKHERAPATSPAQAIFHTVRDGTAATNAGYQGLMLPALEAARLGANAERIAFATHDIVALGDGAQSVSVDDFLRAAAAPRPTMLFSVSHGIGASRRGWRTVEEQRRFQGAMKFGDGRKLTHEEVAGGAFLPGGVWFFFACLGAGTPLESEYRRWLKRLQEIGLFPGPVDDVLRSLPKTGEAPFVARLPQAALANPDGPLSIIGHVDLAWTFGFQELRAIKDPTTGSDTVEAKSRSSRFENVFRTLVEGKRVGAAYGSLNVVFNKANHELTAIFDQEAKDADQGLPPAEAFARKVKKAALWMERQDIAAYVTLGDPATRLNVVPAHGRAAARPAAAEASSAPPPAVASPPPAAAPARGTVKKLDIGKMERAIGLILSEESTVKRVAEKLDVGLDDVTAWVDAYQRAGRQALDKL